MFATATIVRQHELTELKGFLAEGKSLLLKSVVSLAKVAGDCGREERKVRTGWEEEQERGCERTLLQLSHLLLLLLPTLARRDPVPL
jgi:hypothetical protein